MIRALRPFILTYWNGRDAEEAPEEVRAVLAQGRQRPTSNIQAYLLDSSGRPVGWFQPFGGPEGGRLEAETLTKSFLSEFRKATAKMKLPDVSVKTKITLPDVDGPAVRVYTKLRERANRQLNYDAPAVEVVKISDEIRRTLVRPSQATTIEAKALSEWLSQIYPPAMMDGPGFVKSIAGTFEFEPSGEDAATLSGEVDLVLDNKREPKYRLKVEIVLTYKHGALDRVRGYAKGTFQKPPMFDLTAAIESK